MTNQENTEKEELSQDLKWCTKCGVLKDKGDFANRKGGKDGLRAECRDCEAIRRRKYYNKNRDIIIARANKYQQENKEYRSKYLKTYYQEHKKELLGNSKKYQIEHKKERVNYLQKNKKAILVQAKSYRQTEVGRAAFRRKSAKRKARKKNSPIIENFDPKEVFERDGYICQKCGRKTRPDFKNPNHPLYPNLDHIIPLSISGPHTRLNTQCLCRQCNIKKSYNGMGDQLRMFG